MPACSAALAGVGERIVAASAPTWPDWQFVVLDSPQLNAFALPGGKVGVFTGMLQVMANEAQLATVLGHEVGHVTARHGAQRIVAEQRCGAGAAPRGHRCWPTAMRRSRRSWSWRWAAASPMSA